MAHPIITFGEVLWDSLPRGLFPGGAPFNVAGHLAHLDKERAVAIISAVGSDFPGTDLRRRAEQMGVITDHLATLDSHPTGAVEATLDPQGQAAYTIIDDVAWDHIPLTPAIEAAAKAAPALIFGTLACRHSYNRDNLISLLQSCSGLRVYDVNLRPPFTPQSTIDQLLQHADLIKLNDAELAQLTGCDPDLSAIPGGIDILSNRCSPRGVCVTCGPRGAILRWQGQDYFAAAPDVKVRDTIGAGDAFTAALVHGLLRKDETDCTAILSRATALGSFVASQDGAIPH